jgi:hypothetical protein
MAQQGSDYSQQGQRGRQQQSGMEDFSGQGQQQGQWGQGGQAQGQQGQGTYGYGRDDDFSPPPGEQGSTEGQYGTRSGVGYGGASTGGAASSDYDTSQYGQSDPSRKQQQPQYGSSQGASDYDTSQTGTTGTGQQRKPGMGQKVVGEAEKAFGKLTGDSGRAERGQERQSGQQF